MHCEKAFNLGHPDVTPAILLEMREQVLARQARKQRLANVAKVELKRAAALSRRGDQDRRGDDGSSDGSFDSDSDYESKIAASVIGDDDDEYDDVEPLPERVPLGHAAPFKPLALPANNEVRPCPRALCCREDSARLSCT